jgi:hypothetical protein
MVLTTSQSDLTFYIALGISIAFTMIPRMMRDHPIHWSGELVQPLNAELSSQVTFEDTDIIYFAKVPAAALEEYEKRQIITIYIIASRGSVSRSR